MGSDTILSIVSVCATCTGFFLFLTVLLAANSFIKAGTVGKMSITFYCLAIFNGCMWTVYGVLMGSATIALPNAWSVLTTTFAIASYFSVLGKEVAAAKAKASGPTTPIAGALGFPAAAISSSDGTSTIVKIADGVVSYPSAADDYAAARKGASRRDRFLRGRRQKRHGHFCQRHDGCHNGDAVVRGPARPSQLDC